VRGGGGPCWSRRVQWRAGARALSAHLLKSRERSLLATAQWRWRRRFRPGCRAAVPSGRGRPTCSARVRRDGSRQGPQYPWKTRGAATARTVLRSTHCQCFMSAEGRVRVRAQCNASWLHGGHGCDDLEDNDTRNYAQGPFLCSNLRPGDVLCGGHTSDWGAARAASRGEPLHLE